MSAVPSAQETSDPAVMAAVPLVSILMSTYNHGLWLAEAIDGVLAQRCDFTYELIIGEDASTDDTLQIALTYQNRFPSLIRVIHSGQNVGAIANDRRIFAAARGEFIAYCEGDDYWCDSLKLARQVALIQGDPRIGIVHTDWVRAKFTAGRWQFDFSNSVHRRVPDKYLRGDLFPTFYFPKILRSCTVLFRREIAQQRFDSWIGKKSYRFGDIVRNAHFASRWRIAYDPAVTAVYRESPNSALRSGAVARVAFYRSSLEFDDDARRFFADQDGYPDGFRWDTDVALLLWSLRARDWSSARLAVRDAWRYFGVFKFLMVGWRTLVMRMPTWKRQLRRVPSE
jgi:glycosyltransferase involved in cell wall biosynthesis